MDIQKVNLEEKFEKISDYWNPRVAGSLNGQLVKLAKFKGEFVWHHHANEDEMFVVISGEFEMHLREKIVNLKKGEFIIIPRGTEHKPVAREEVEVMLFEPSSTLNTGNISNNLTKRNLDEI